MNFDRHICNVLLFILNICFFLFSLLFSLARASVIFYLQQSSQATFSSHFDTALDFGDEFLMPPDGEEDDELKGIQDIFSEWSDGELAHFMFILELI